MFLLVEPITCQTQGPCRGVRARQNEEKGGAVEGRSGEMGGAGFGPKSERRGENQKGMQKNKWKMNVEKNRWKKWNKYPLFDNKKYHPHLAIGGKITATLFVGGNMPWEIHSIIIFDSAEERWKEGGKIRANRQNCKIQLVFRKSKKEPKTTKYIYLYIVDFKFYIYNNVAWYHRGDSPLSPVTQPR